MASKDVVDNEVRASKVGEVAADSPQLVATDSLPEGKGVQDSLSKTFNFFWAGGSRSQQTGTSSNMTKPVVTEDPKKDP